MKNSLLIITFLISSALMAQTKVSVSVQSFSFTPSVINIIVGDTVEWTNVGGSHNVNGTQATFSSNPASFGNSVGPGWTYSFKFTTAGTYNFQCDPHSSTMNGTVNVQLATSVKTESLKEVNQFYPNPAVDQLNFSNYKEIKQVTIYTLTGEMVLSTKLTSRNLNVEILDAGIYFVKISDGEDVVTQKLIVQ
jgi:plastocyanin